MNKRGFLLLVFLSISIGSGYGQKPNVIFILADDLGWGDLQCYGNPYVETPSINRLAAEGIRFTDYYSPSPLCAPARAALLTGRFNHRTGAVDVSSNRGIDRIALSELTMGDYFKHAGYATALIGKWHNGLYNEAYLPYHRGFDLFYGFPNGGQDYYKYNLMRNGVYEKNDGCYMTDVFSQEAIRFVEQHQDKPFFLFLSHHAPHIPYLAPDSLIDKYVRRIGNKLPRQDAILYAMIEVMDRGIGELVDKLEALKLRENTIIVFTSDNGGQYSSRELRRYQGALSGEKGNVLEQGIRVPAIVSWKGKTESGCVIGTPVHGCDWLPSLYSLTGVVSPKNAKPFDGKDLSPMLLGRKIPELAERKIFFQKTRYTPVRYSDGSVRMGPWKLYWPMIDETMKKDIGRDNPSYEKGLVDLHWEMPLDSQLPTFANVKVESPQLFNLERDPSERYDVATEHPNLVSYMADSYNNWFDSVEKDWKISWAEIKRQDSTYWEKKLTPDPEELFEKYWRWDVIKSEDKARPLRTFKGYWSSPSPRK